jgi:hypothetical protein
VGEDGDSPMHGVDVKNGRADGSTAGGDAISGNTSTMTSSSSSSASVVSSSSSSSSSGVSSASSPSDLAPVRSLNEVLSLTAKALVKEALDRRSLDNVTVMIIAL